MAQRGNGGRRDDQEQAASTVVVTVRLDGVQYELDLSAADARKLRADLRPWIGRSRQVGGQPAPRRPSRGNPARIDRIQVAKMRQWARQNGHPISSRGRVPAVVQRAFAEAHA